MIYNLFAFREEKAAEDRIMWLQGAGESGRGSAKARLLKFDCKIT